MEKDTQQTPIKWYALSEQEQVELLLTHIIGCTIYESEKAYIEDINYIFPCIVRGEHYQTKEPTYTLFTDSMKARTIDPLHKWDDMMSLVWKAWPQMTLTLQEHRNYCCIRLIDEQGIHPDEVEFHLGTSIFDAMAVVLLLHKGVELDLTPREEQERKGRNGRRQSKHDE